jgi:phosphoenolpyruvate carboxylase
MENKNNYKRNANIELSKIVSLLGKILGSVIKEQEGVSLYNKIEKIRSLSKASRGKKTKKKNKVKRNEKISSTNIKY